MITPHKYLNLDLSLLNISAFLLQEFKKNSILTYDEIVKSCTNSFGENVKEVVPYALCFLYLLEKIEYLENGLDAFELKGLQIEA